MHLGSLESTLLTLTLLSCSPNFPRASITRYTHAKHEPILKYSRGLIIGRIFTSEGGGGRALILGRAYYRNFTVPWRDAGIFFSF